MPDNLVEWWKNSQPEPEPQKLEDWWSDLVPPVPAAEPPLYATQGGGYATCKDGQFVWHSDIPDFVDAQVGDPIPEEWSTTAINEAAREIDEEYFGDPWQWHDHIADTARQYDT